MTLPYCVRVKMDRHKVKIDGVELRVDIARDPDVIKSRFETEIHSYQRQQQGSQFAVGFDCRGNSISNPSLSYNRNNAVGAVVVCLPNNYCLVAKFNNGNDSAMQDLKSAIEKLGSSNTCVFGVDLTCTGYWDRNNIANDISVGINAGELAARVALKPNLYSSTDMAVIAPVFEVSYDAAVGRKRQPGPAFDSSEKSKTYWQKFLFSEDELKGLVYDAYICCKIGTKFLSDLPSA